MPKINTLIVENSPASRSIIKRGVKWYNAKNTGCDISIVGEAETYEDAIAIINNQTEPIHLVFLDIELNSPKTGLDICKEFPRIAYIVVSIDPTALKWLTNEIAVHPYYYVEKAAEAAFGADSIVTAIENYVSAKEK